VDFFPRMSRRAFLAYFRVIFLIIVMSFSGDMGLAKTASAPDSNASMLFSKDGEPIVTSLAALGKFLLAKKIRSFPSLSGSSRLIRSAS
jgi:hypothetical protein